MGAFPKLQRLRVTYTGSETRAFQPTASLFGKLSSFGAVRFIAYVSLLVGSMLILQPERHTKLEGDKTVRDLNRPPRLRESKPEDKRELSGTGADQA